MRFFKAGYQIPDAYYSGVVGFSTFGLFGCKVSSGRVSALGLFDKIPKYLSQTPTAARWMKPRNVLASFS